MKVGGKVAQANVSVGDRVVAGQVLVSLSTGDTLAQLAQAQASVLVEEALLAELVRGSRTEEVKVQEVKVTNGKK